MAEEIQATVRAIAVAPELLASMSGSMADAVTVMRGIEAKLDALTKAHEADRARVEPALLAHADHLRRLAEADAEVTADARAAKRKAETEALKNRAELQSLAVRIIVQVGALIIAALAGAGATSALGGLP